ncbi:MAG: trimethylamine methyltransferase family protein [Deltaproteobacteria bacterium]|nr:trimethylamine methyltransferase family protein [Deltaproteobacteria bacterium]
MNRVLFNFDTKMLDQIHHFSMELLNDTGIRFPNKEALELFKHHGFKIEGEKVFFNQQNIEKSLETVL